MQMETGLLSRPPVHHCLVGCAIASLSFPSLCMQMETGLLSRPAWHLCLVGCAIASLSFPVLCRQFEVGLISRHLLHLCLVSCAIASPSSPLLCTQMETGLLSWHSIHLFLVWLWLPFLSCALKKWTLTSQFLRLWINQLWLICEMRVEKNGCSECETSFVLVRLSVSWSVSVCSQNAHLPCYYSVNSTAVLWRTVAENDTMSIQKCLIRTILANG